ncbi:MAG: acyl-ACP--UDP-N-acetylglucosamine O-acyltransferase [Ignavibacteriales bacterium]|nr:acyl-ACP--UDP-N-acetylglucosamine O-acyltransferase [Ignavibacteriales bacterium]
MIKQHPTAIVSNKAQIGENVEIAPYAIINDDVIIGDGTYIGPHAVVYDGARIGKNVKIFQSASIAHRPQDLKFADEKTELFIGDNTVIHEFVTLHKGTTETWKTTIGSDVLMMAYSHVAHDCHVGNKVILANGVQIAGHVHIDDWTIIGGMTPVHQFCKVGKHCMIGGGFRVVQDVPPYILCGGEPLKYSGLNLVGLRRRGFTHQQIENIKQVYSYLYSPHYNVSQAKQLIGSELSGNTYAEEILGFLANGKRGIIGK